MPLGSESVRGPSEIRSGEPSFARLGRIGDPSPHPPCPLLRRYRLPQFASQDLARRCPGHGVNEIHLPRLLVVGKAIGDESTELVFQRVGSQELITQYDEST